MSSCSVGRIRVPHNGQPISRNESARIIRIKQIELRDGGPDHERQMSNNLPTSVCSRQNALIFFAGMTQIQLRISISAQPTRKLINFL